MTNKPNPKLARNSHPSSSNTKPKSSGATQRRKNPSRVFRRFEIQESTIPEENIWVRFRQNLHTFCGTVFSFLVHTFVLIVLALFVYAKQEPKQLGMVAEFVAKPELVVNQPDDAPLVIEIANDSEDHSSLEAGSTENAVADDIPVPTIADSTANDSAENLAPIENSAPVAPVAPSIIGGGLEGRTSGSRSSLASQMGGSAQSELAVENG